MTDAPTRAGRHRWLWIAAIWLAGALFDASQNVLIMRAEGKHHSWLPLFATELALWLPWALATPGIFRLAQRRPFVRGALPAAFAAHVPAFVVLAVVTEAWSATLQVAFNPWDNRRPPRFGDTFSTSLLYQALTLLIVYVLLVTIASVREAKQREARQAIERARLDEELSRAQLAALRRQIEPHFMYNTLHAITGLVRDHRNETAVSMLVGLSEFLRRATDDSGRAEVPLAEEVDYLQRYVEIQKLRFGERLQFGVDIPAALLEARVPHLLLQPLVENAIKHGVAQRVAGGRVHVAAAMAGDRLCLVVSNDGPSVPEDAAFGTTGVGLANLRERLRILHGERFGLSMRRPAPACVEVRVELPWRTGA